MLNYRHIYVVFVLLFTLSGGTLFASSGSHFTSDDSTEWAVWGNTQAFLLKFERLVDDTLVLHGDFLASFEGRLIMEGSFQKGRKNGRWQHYDMNTEMLTAEGQYVAGLRHNVWIFYTATGQKKAQKRYYYGELKGQLISWYNNGNTRMQGILQNDSTLQSLDFFYANGDTALHRNFRWNEDGLLEVDHRSYYKTGPRYEHYGYLIDTKSPTIQRQLNFYQDPLDVVFGSDPVNDPRLEKDPYLLDGSYRRYHDSGYLWEHLSYDKGLLFEHYEASDQWGKPQDKGNIVDGTGQRITYHRGGDTALIANYVNGVLHGPILTYEEQNRKSYQGNYKSGKRHGEWKIYDIEERLKVICDFQGDTAYFSETKRGDIIDYRGMYVNGMLEGPWLTFDYYGDTLRFDNYERGLLEGEFREYRSESLYKSGYYSKGVPTGVWNTYNVRQKITWTDSIPPVTYVKLLEPQNQLLTGPKVVSDYRFKPAVTYPTVPDFMIYPSTQKIGDKFFEVRIEVGKKLRSGEVVFLVTVEDTGHVTGIESIKFNRPEFYEYALGVLQQLPFMYPMQFEGVPRNSKQRIAFTFKEL
ncbi:MAG: hypothetical protein MK081_02125 [Flavobacteriales bacterium]|nr:hypothetical protein [Flavobacteriales bacterium]